MRQDTYDKIIQLLDDTYDGNLSDVEILERVKQIAEETATQSL